MYFKLRNCVRQISHRIVVHQTPLGCQLLTIFFKPVMVPLRGHKRDLSFREESANSLLKGLFDQPQTTLPESLRS